MISVIDGLKIGAGALAGASLMITPACVYGQRIERQSAQVEEAKSALSRIQKLEKSNAAFKSLPARDRCIIFMRDSELPVATCD
ncbi:hypothetical protein ACRQ1B_06045 [Rhizobium panacihumi]|uniref:hypothetical protein n=1 Tax=Rhizobium panacihumi TaxID=2008450 RepID=UPI003D7A3918